MTLYRKSLLVGALALVAPFVHAQQTQLTSPSFKVTANVQSVCTFTSGGSPSDVNFGTYDPTASVEKTAQGSATLLCTQGTPLFVFIETVGAREMTGPGGAKLPYELTTDSAGQTQFPSARPTTSNYQGTGSSQNIPYFGRIAPGKFVTPGSYQQQAVFNVQF